MKTEELKRLWNRAFGDEMAVIDAFFSTAYAPERCRYLEEHGRVTAALHWMDGEWDGQKFAYIYAVATDPDYRGRGLCRKLMDRTHRDLAEMGYAGAILMPAQPGLRGMYAKMGYRECTTISQFDCEAGKAVAVWPIDRAEYARLRRKYLPEGGLIQEGEHLNYLEAFGAVYAGADFVLAAVHEEGHLFGMELLGNVQAAPGILGAMGYETGTFRVPGGEIPFGMGIVFQDNGKLPGYLGLAFD